MFIMVQNAHEKAQAASLNGLDGLDSQEASRARAMARIVLDLIASGGSAGVSASSKLRFYKEAESIAKVVAGLEQANSRTGSVSWAHFAQAVEQSVNGYGQESGKSNEYRHL